LELIKLLTTLEKKERIEYYKENGKEKYAKKYKCKPSSIESCIFYYMKVLGIKPYVNQMACAKLKEILNYYENNTKEKTCEKYGISKSALHSKIYYAKCKFNIKCKRKEDALISKEKKLEIIMYYKKHSSIETAKKYGYKSGKAIVSSVNKWAIDLGVPKPLKYRTNFNSLTNEEKRERVDDYLKYGIKYVKEKYGYIANSYSANIRVYAKQLGIYIPEGKHFHTRQEQKEMIKYYEENGKEAFKKKYGVADRVVKNFKHIIKADANMDNGDDIIVNSYREKRKN